MDARNPDEENRTKFPAPKQKPPLIANLPKWTITVVTPAPDSGRSEFLHCTRFDMERGNMVFYDEAGKKHVLRGFFHAVQE